MESYNGEMASGRPRKTGRSVLRIIGFVCIGLIFAALFALVFGFLVKWLWNWLMPVIFGLGVITYWQAFGLVILSKILFGVFGHHPSGHKPPFMRFHDRIHSGTDRSGPSHFWSHRGDYRRFWREEGQAAFDAYMDRLEKKRSNGSDQAGD